MHNRFFFLTTAGLLAAVMFQPFSAAAQNNSNFNLGPGPAEGEPVQLGPPEPIQSAPVPAPIPPAPPVMPPRAMTQPPPEATNYAMPASSTDLQVRMNALDSMMRNLTGQVERITFQNNQLLQSLQRMQGDSDVRFRQMESRMAQQDAAMQQMARDIQQAALGLPPPGASGETPPSASAPAPAAAPPAPAAAAATHAEEEEEDEEIDTPAPAPPAAKANTSKTLGTISSARNEESAAQGKYDRAFAALREAKYDVAEENFRLFLKDHPKHRLSENATYWLAETYYVRGKFENAAAAFAESFEKYPKGQKAPDNLLKLSMSLAALKKTKDACTTLDELLKRYPDAAAVTKTRATAQKKNLECGT